MFLKVQKPLKNIFKISNNKKFFMKPGTIAYDVLIISDNVCQKWMGWSPDSSEYFGSGSAMLTRIEWPQVPDGLDAIVIGSGIGGLSTAVIMAKVPVKSNN